MRKLMWRWMLGVCAVMFLGCIPLPLAVPPSKLTASIGSHVESAPDASKYDGFGGHYDLRGAVYPLQMWTSDRWFDVGIGYAYSDDLRQDRKEHGPFFDMAVFFEDVGIGRPGATFQLRLLSTPEESAYIQGFATAFQLSIEIVDFATGDSWDAECSGDGCVVGTVAGEGGIGLYAEVVYEQLQSRSRIEGSVGVLVRTPMVLGVMLVPIWNAL